MLLNAKPFVGVDVNYTMFFKERVNISSADLDLDDSVGVVGHIGIDFPYAETESFCIDARYMDVKTDATLNGADIGEIDTSQWVYGVALVKKF